ncbi:conjugative transposon protein TraK [Aquimarina litoralis]|uniref:Conjugative transposon protein TraK n=1 Tax=Aquimarina litoralis TaxID=584605 RepID=A0ABN1IKV8_9FLAO
MDLKSLKNIPASFALAKRALLYCLIISTLISIGSLVWAFVTTNNIKNTAFVLTKDGQAAMMQGISLNEVDEFRKPEIINHIKMFHESFWEIDQFNYKRRIDRALYLSGRSGKQLFKTLQANGHLAKLVTENLTQKIDIDSIKVNDKVTPYKAKFYGKLRVSRTDQKVESVNEFRANFVLHNVARTNENPHGLLIENYLLKSKPISIPK